MKALVFTLVFFFATGFVLKGQQKDTMAWSGTRPYRAIHSMRLNAPLPHSSKESLYLNVPAKKLPFFCSMEEKSRVKLKVVLKFRAGDDESYRKMIGRTYL